MCLGSYCLDLITPRLSCLRHFPIDTASKCIEIAERKTKPHFFADCAVVYSGLYGEAKLVN